MPEAAVDTVAEEWCASGLAIHYHVWNRAAFADMVAYIDRDVAAWADVWSHPTLPHPEHDIEFYFLLTK